MATERETLKTLSAEYKNLSSALEGFVHTLDLDEEFKRLHELEDQLLSVGNILATETLLPGKNVIIRQGDGGESSSYFQGEVEEIFSNLDGEATAIKLKNGKEIPFHRNITLVSIIRNRKASNS